MAETNKCFPIRRAIAQKNITYSSINFFVKVCFLQFEGSWVIFNFSVRIVLYIHCSLFAFCLANSGVPVGLKISNLSWSNVFEQVKVPVVNKNLRCLTVKPRINTWATPISASRFTAAVCAFPKILSTVMIHCNSSVMISAWYLAIVNPILIACMILIYNRNLPRDAR